MSNNTAPDSWEQQADSGPGESSPSDPADVTAKFSTLNVNAVEFVPSFGVKTSQGDDHNSPTKSQKSESSTNSPDQSPVVNGTCLNSALSTTCCSVFLFLLENIPSLSHLSHLYLLLLSKSTNTFIEKIGTTLCANTLIYRYFLK